MLRALIKSMRPRQWLKNVFIFAALVFDRKLANTQALVATILGFILFCLLSSAVYLLNDIGDIEADRNHPKKRLRPLPSGQLPVPVAWAAIVVILIIVFPLSFALSTSFGLVATLYFVLNVAYTKWLKHIPILDVLVLASFLVMGKGLGASGG